MDKIIVESSSDEDDTYTNSVARLRALKKQRLEKEKHAAPTSVEVVQVITNGTDRVIQTEPERVIQTEPERVIQTRSTRYRGRARGRSRTNTARLTKRKRSSTDNIEYDIEIISVEDKPGPIPKSCKDNVIALSSDDDACSEDDNYEMDIKVLWRSSRIDRLSIRRYDSFLKIFQHYADLEKVSLDEILIMRKDKIINRTDTPALLKLSVIDILDGGIVNPGMNTLSKNESKNSDDDICSIKVQTASKKQSLTITLRRDQRFKALFITCAEQLGVNENSLKFYFDGEQINSTDTPESLDLEGEACIDLHISST